MVELNHRHWVLALGIASNHGVPCEHIGPLDMGKYLVGIGHWSRKRHCGEDEVFAHIWVGEWDTMPYREGVDLFEFGLGGSTALQESNAFLENQGEWILWAS